jgi:hypothetical protein
MGRKPLYSSVAERQKAYRQRLQARQQGQPLAPPTSQRRPPSRPARLTALLEDAEVLRDEYESWFDNLPPGIRESNLAERLQETVEQLNAVVAILTDLDPPRGYDRD